MTETDSSVDEAARGSSAFARFAIEGFVIVVSILLAFALDAWWDARVEASEEQSLLARLDAELVATDSVLAESETSHRSIAEAAGTLRELTGPDPRPAVSRDSILRLITVAVGGVSANPPTGVIDAAISSGQIGIIENDELRIALAGWPAVLADLHENEQQVRDVLFSRFIPYLDGQIAWGYDTDGGSAFDDGLLEVLGSREFENLLMGRVALSRSVIGQYGSVRRQLDELRSRIERELDAGQR